LDDCSKCDIYVDGKKQEKLKGMFDDFLDDSVKVYRYDNTLGAVEKDKETFFNIEGVEERVCFSYRMGQSGVGEQVLISFKEKVYDYTSYFEDTPVYDTMEELVEQKDKRVQDILK
jgi:cytochrome b involved in lipid metabolism